MSSLRYRFLLNIPISTIIKDATKIQDRAEPYSVKIVVVDQGTGGADLSLSLPSIITPADGTPYVVPPKSTKRETKPSPPRSRKPEQASTRFQGREKQASKLNPNAAEFEPSVSVYASIVPGETSFVTAPDGTSLACVFANVFVATNHLNSILTQSFGVLSLNATRLH